MKSIPQLLFFLITSCVYSQNNHLTIDAELISNGHFLKTHQQITYYNQSNDTLKKIILRNWGNSYKDRKTPLAKRLLEDYKTDFYFSSKSEKGFSKINSILVNQKSTVFEIPKHQKDLIVVSLNNPLAPQEKTQIAIDYLLKIPNAKFTGNGYKGLDYYLSDWYISPSTYHKGWDLDTHKNLNYQHNLPLDYHINFKVPIGFHIYSDFETKKETNNSHTQYTLTGKNCHHADLSLTFLKSYLEVPTSPVALNTNFLSTKLPISNQKKSMQTMLSFLKEQLGVYPEHQLLVEKHKYNKNPIYELKFLPDWLHPFSNEFKWEAEFFKALSTEYISQVLTVDKKKDYWLIEGLEIYLFQKYIQKYYPDVKIAGRLSEIWGLRSMYISKQKFADKFSIVHQITARENLDQSLNTALEDLSNFNEKVISPYKAGLGFLYLKEYVGSSTFDNVLSDFLHAQLHKETSGKAFLELLQQNTSKDISWYTNEWLNTSKKIDHKITKAEFSKDSVTLKIKNKRSIQTPVLVYGLKGSEIKSKTWVDGFKDTQEIKIKNDSLDKVVLNYENTYPEINYRDNWKNKKPKLFERPLQIKLFKDLNNPHKHQLFLKPEASYNYYDGVILGVSVQNKAYMHKNFEYTLKPTYSTGSNSLTGGFNLNYTVYPEETNIYEASFGISGSNYFYDQELNYNTFAPFAAVSFKQKNFRALGTNQIRARFLKIDKEVPQGVLKSDEDQYSLFKMDYLYRQNKLINDYRLNINTEIASKFSKLNVDFRYRHLTNNKRPIEFRFFGGVFLNNRTDSDYFSFNQHTPNDYLFELPYLGRSETSGLLSQQYFKAQGGFVTQNNPGFANQWLTSINTSVGIWRWIETFHNISLLKNRGQNAFFDVEGGVKIAFVPDLFEIYLPVYNKEGLLTKVPNYWETPRFIVTLKAQTLVKFLKQQIF